MTHNSHHNRNRNMFTSFPSFKPAHNLNVSPHHYHDNNPNYNVNMNINWQFSPNKSQYQQPNFSVPSTIVPIENNTNISTGNGNEYLCIA